MVTSLKELIEIAGKESKKRGFRSMGIYHLLWVVHKREPGIFESWLKKYQIEPVPLIKMLENVLRPRRAGGGVPRDQHEANLMEEAVGLATRLAEKQGEEPSASHLGKVLADLGEDPLLSLCERFCLDCSPPQKTVE